MPLEFVALPDDVLVCIGKAVLEFSGAESFVRLTQTSKRVHRILTNKEILPVLLAPLLYCIATQFYEPFVGSQISGARAAK